MGTIELSDDDRKYHEAILTALLLRVDIEERYLGKSPRTAEIRKANKEGVIIEYTQKNTSVGG